jgi:hypothetical protein
MTMCLYTSVLYIGPSTIERAVHVPMPRMQRCLKTLKPCDFVGITYRGVAMVEVVQSAP